MAGLSSLFTPFPHTRALLRFVAAVVSETIYTVVFISSYLSPLPTRAGTLSVFTEVSLVHPHQCLHTESTQ